MEYRLVIEKNNYSSRYPWAWRIEYFNELGGVWAQSTASDGWGEYREDCGTARNEKKAEAAGRKELERLRRIQDEAIKRKLDRENSIAATRKVIT